MTYQKDGHIFYRSGNLLIDLTLLFGEGKEPTEEELKEYFPVGTFDNCEKERKSL